MDVEDVRLAVYAELAATGRAPAATDLAQRFGVEAPEVAAALQVLHEQRHLVRLARGWYAGRLERGYVRREPAAAAAYFAEVGLTGAFWGLP